MSSTNSTLCDELDEVHCDALLRSIKNVLATDLASTTYAQIIDGLPLADVAWDQYTSKICDSHPINEHVNLCPGVTDKAKDLLSDFDVETLKFDQALLRAFQTAPPSSARAFDMRLLELTAVALHQIGVLLFQLQLELHDPRTTHGLDIESVTSWEQEPKPPFPRIVPDPTLFTNPRFTAQDQYPNGLADVVGYWAENRILGGVLLFDRSQNWELDNEPNAFVDCSRYDVTYRTCQLLDEQQATLLRFMRDTESNMTCPLPILPTEKNRNRINPEDAIPVHQVYRDPWERSAPKRLLRMQKYMEDCVISSLDFPEYGTDEEFRDRLRDLKERGQNANRDRDGGNAD
ncbi:hypothetical protein G7054_g4584 [Neopestalotiopsis clavispora]|nr:hypothetical protein G7054_g4584 [Neopestalotiopsis clavispora]